MTGYLLSLLILLCIFALAALALNLTLGWGGIVNLGHVGLMGVGGYTSAILSARLEWPVIPSMCMGVLAAGFASFVLSFLLRKLNGDSLAVVLLGFNLAIYTVALNWTALTRGPLGIPAIPRPPGAHSDLGFLFLALILLIAVVYLLYRLTGSPFGRVLSAVRDDELHARVLGKRVFRVKQAGFVLSGLLAGLAGVLYAHFIGFIDPNSFFLHQLVIVLSILFVGGLASLHGTLLAAVIMTFLPEAIRYIPGIPPTIIGAIRGMVFSGILLAIVLFRPKGLFGKIELPSSYADGS